MSRDKVFLLCLRVKKNTAGQTRQNSACISIIWLHESQYDFTLVLHLNLFIVYQLSDMTSVFEEFGRPGCCPHFSSHARLWKHDAYLTTTSSTMLIKPMLIRVYLEDILRMWHYADNARIMLEIGEVPSRPSARDHSCIEDEPMYDSDYLSLDIHKLLHEISLNFRPHRIQSLGCVAVLLQVFSLYKKSWAIW